MESIISNKHAYDLKVTRKPNDEAMLGIEMSLETYHTNWWWGRSGRRARDERETKPKQPQGFQALNPTRSRQRNDLE